MTLVVRKINLSFSLGQGNFGESGQDTVNLKGYRTSVSITKSGGASLSEAQIRVWGMPLDVMQKLTVLNKLAYEQERRNTVTIEAGDDESGMAVNFVGTIKEAWADASNAPDIVFIVSAFTGGIDAVRPVPATSYKGSVTVETLLSGIAAQMVPPRSLENNGVQVTLVDPYLPGTLRDQLTAVSRMARCNIITEDGPAGSVLAIWPLGQARKAQVLKISSETGLVGYPQFTQNGIAFTTLYTPALIFGQQVTMKSALEAANGSWVIAAVQHNLDAELPGGQWFTRVECGLLGHPAPVIGTPS